jgi:hypothetical protein
VDGVLGYQGSDGIRLEDGIAQYQYWLLLL